MIYDPINHHRRSIRLRGYDYSQKGAYYITICTQKRICRFGQVIETGTPNALVELNEVGQMIEKAWLEIPVFYPGVELDQFVVMPNHLHGIFVLVQTGGMAAFDVVHRLKSWTTNQYGNGVKKCVWPAYEKRFWHRNYYEHIIRDEDDLNRIRRYIIENPIHWPKDKLNPQNPL